MDEKEDPLDHLGLARSIAKRYRRRGFDFEDFCQEAFFGLNEACERFDPSLGKKFSTYARYWIREAIGEAIRDRGRPIRIPAYLQEHISKGHTPDTPGLKPRLRLRLREALAVHGASHMADELPFVTQRESESFDAEFAAKAVAALKTLPSREATVIRLRCGLSSEPMTREAIGRLLGLSKTRVKQIERSALDRLRNRLGV